MAVKALAPGKPARKRGRPPSHAGSGEARRQAILDAARDVFVHRGYAESSVDAVIERVGGSKATIYALFGSKEGLLSAVAAKCGAEFTDAVEKVDVSTSPAESLRRIARAYCKAAFDARRLAMYRMAVGESGRRPESGDIYYRLGPRATLAVVEKFFRECADKGVIETSDPDLLADGFLAALRGSLFNRAVLNPTRVPTQPEIDHHIDFIVDTFLRGVRPTTANGPPERL
ncbi:MAG TPA: TetR/AcrR family transcriptional regulator [Alphaproteobacteria bacterium]